MKINQDILLLRNKKLGSDQSVVGPNPTYDKFRLSSLKIAIQRRGELTKPSLAILKKMFGYMFQEPADRELVTFEGDGDITIVWSRNKSIYKLVSQGAVDLAIVGSDQLVERGCGKSVITIKTFEDVAQWPLVLAIANPQISKLYQIKTIATQYPNSVSKILKKLGIKASIINVEGGTEAYAYLKINNISVDAVIDISVTGETMKQNDLIKVQPNLATYYPVLIANHKSFQKIKTRFPNLAET